MVVDEHEAARRAARRQVVKALHPDRGGDPEAFRVALASLEVRPGAVRAEAPTVGRRRPDPRTRARRLLRLLPRRRRYARLS